MDPERCRHIEDLYHSAGERHGGEREAFLRAACDGDEELGREVESLLAQQSRDTPLDRPAWDMALGGRLGPYELLAPVGSGGMGTVFKARDTRLNRSVAIKISAAQFSGRFANEARALPEHSPLEIDDVLNRLAAIDPVLRQVVELRVEGLTREEIAREMGCGTATVALHWSFARHPLEEVFAGAAR